MAQNPIDPALFTVCNSGNTNQTDKVTAEEVARLLDGYTDYHNSVYDILARETYTILPRKQMLVKELLILDGTLIIEGQLFLEV